MKLSRNWKTQGNPSALNSKYSGYFMELRMMTYRYKQHWALKVIII